MSDATSPPDFLEKLWERKFLQIFGTYLAVGFGLLQFLEFLVNRYGVSSAYIDKYLVLWLLSVPAVAVLIYYRGRLPRNGARGRRSWQRWFVPLNLGLSGLLAIMLFGGGEAQAAAEIVTATDESGQSVAALVPDATKVKYISVFGFDNASGRTEEDWWGTGISYLLSLDLRQRPDLYPSESMELTTHYDKMGLKPFTHIGVAAQRRIAQKVRSQYFISGSYEIDEAGIYTVEGAVQRTRDGKKLFDISARDSDPFAAIEQIGDQIIAGLPDPVRMDDVATDLPVAALITDQVPALRALIQSYIQLMNNPQDMGASLEIVRRAVAADPNCSICKFSLANTLLGMEKRDSAILLMQEAVRMSATLPQREQIGIRSLLYSAQGDLGKYFDLQEMGRKLFPYDYSYYGTLINYYMGTKGIDASIELMEEAVANGHEERGLLKLAQLYQEKRDYEEAERILDRFFELYPERTEDRLLYVTLYERQDLLDRAREVLGELSTLDPLNMDYQFKLTDLLLREGKYQEAADSYRDLLGTATNHQDTARALHSLAGTYERQGRVGAALEVFEQLEQAYLQVMPRPNVVGRIINASLDTYLSVGRETGVDSLIAEIGQYLPQIADIYRCVKVRNLVQLDWAERSLAAEVRDCREVGLAQGMTPEALDFFTAYAEQDYPRAADLLTAAESQRVVLTTSDKFKVEVYLRADQPDRAREILTDAISARGELPEYLLQRFRIDGNRADLDRALELWRNADPDYIPAQRARELAAS